MPLWNKTYEWLYLEMKKRKLKCLLSSVRPRIKDCIGKILDDEVLHSYMKKYFYKEIERLQKALIIPLGKAVEEVLCFMIDEGIIKKEQCSFGFPHPSGANGHRKKQFEDNKENLLNKVNCYFD